MTTREACETARAFRLPVLVGVVGQASSDRTVCSIWLPSIRDTAGEQHPPRQLRDLCGWHLHEVATRAQEGRRLGMDTDHPVPAARPSRKGRISLSQDPAVSLQYAGELIAAFIERAGGSVKGKISPGSVPEGLEPAYVHRQSRSLSEILVELLRASNNYIANQIFLEIGGHRLGGAVSLEKSLKVANEMLAANGLAAAIHVASNTDNATVA